MNETRVTMITSIYTILVYIGHSVKITSGDIIIVDKIMPLFLFFKAFLNNREISL